MSHPISAPLPQQQQQQHMPSVGLARTDTDADNERLELSERSAGDNTDTSALMTAHHDEPTAAAAMATCITGESHLTLDVHCSFLRLHRRLVANGVVFSGCDNICWHNIIQIACGNFPEFKS